MNVYVPAFVLSAPLVQRSAELLSRAKRPLLLLGSQATLPPTSIHSIRRSVEALGVPCFLGGMSRGLLGKNSQLQLRHQRKEALKEADLVILAGIVCDFRLSYGRVLPRGVPVIAVNRDKDQLYRVMTSGKLCFSFIRQGYTARHVARIHLSYQAEDSPMFYRDRTILCYDFLGPPISMTFCPSFSPSSSL